MVSQNIVAQEFGISLNLADSQNVIKACLFNLIIVANSLERALYCQDLMRIITAKYPCRIIFIRVDDTAQSDLLRTSRTIQQSGVGSNAISCDLFSIEMSSNQTYKVPFLILPNIVPDLPVYLLLGQDPSQDSAILSEIGKYANRVIFDAERIDNYARFSQRILQAFQDHSEVYIDMNWAKTKAWREVFARVFNDQNQLQVIKEAKEITLSYVAKMDAPDSKYAIQSVYIQAWLASQLGWTFVGVAAEKNSVKVTYQNHDKPIMIILAPRETSTLEPGAVHSVEILTYNDSHYLIAQDGSTQNVIVHASSPERCEMPYTLLLNNFQRGSALVGEIFYQPPSEHYVKMLQSLTHSEWSKKVFN